MTTSTRKPRKANPFGKMVTTSIPPTFLTPLRVVIAQSKDDSFLDYLNDAVERWEKDHVKRVTSTKLSSHYQTSNLTPESLSKYL